MMEKRIDVYSFELDTFTDEYLHGDIRNLPKR